MKMKRLFFISFILSLLMTNAVAKIPIYIIAGQSNADGRAFINEMPDGVRQYVTDGGMKNVMISYCNGTTRTKLGEFAPYVPMYEGNNSSKCGFDAVLFHYISQSSNTPYYIIKEAKGGTAIDTLCKSGGGLYWNASPEWLRSAGVARYVTDTKTTEGKSLLLQLESNIDSCIANTFSLSEDGYEFKCIIWHQGESDRGASDAYYTNLKQLVNHLRQHIARSTGDDTYLSLPFIAGGVNRDSRMYSKKVEEAKIRLSEEDANFHYVNLDGCDLRSDDRLHFNGKGCVKAADRLYSTLSQLNLLP